MSESEISYKGESMSPLFQEGDRLVYKEMTRFGAGDVIIFYDGDSKEITAHRCISMNPEVLVKGDSSVVFDHFIHSHYLGLVTKVIRGEKTIDIRTKQFKNSLISKLSYYSSDRFGKPSRYLSQTLIRLIVLFY